MVEDIHADHNQCRENIEIANAKYAKYHEAHRSLAPSIKVRDQVNVVAHNISTQRPSKKLDVKRRNACIQA